MVLGIDQKHQPRLDRDTDSCAAAHQQDQSADPLHGTYGAENEKGPALPKNRHG